MREVREREVQQFISHNGHNYYREWLDGLDKVAQARVLVSVDRLRFSVGDIKSLATNLWELRFHFGPGYRVYFTTTADNVVLLLAGSRKVDQSRTIRLAKRLVKEALEEGDAPSTT